ncbi:adenylate/guanylate cyclase domain-containing protein [Cellulophaga tyrosinoxydans]|uniref:Adenylate cyclase, class 3 n=1 Tax=Cellulophaga tyrosinoxydans TaxID=504486 RepID=A0A1W2BIK5_9FLAO|nr:adenylate/guanylate cyclase domain-containing protein [Cellulophaga tyrosinoxydans]SMC72701.1 Adenylate cyclase, class 3 [Cellulophaga tyrosinoxydans]
MKIYNDYLQIIKDAVESDASNQIYKGLGSPIHSRTNEQFKAILNRVESKEIASEMKMFSEGLGRPINYNQQLGLHPSFAHLKNTDNVEEHYIVSVFIDIKGSTNLFKKFDKETNFLITNAIIKAGIHTALIFGGYVHRLQGDGMFLYFGDENTEQKKAVELALQMVSVYTHFVKNDLKEYLMSQGIENIGVRTGIDLGKKEDVLWGNSGIGEISEVTTCSLHTSLASKMQSSALRNGVVVGQYVKDEILADDIFSLVCNRPDKTENDRYIYRIDDRNFYYSQYDFNWEKYLKKQSFVAIDSNGNPVIKLPSSVNTISALKPIAAINKPYFNEGKNKT